MILDSLQLAAVALNVVLLVLLIRGYLRNYPVLFALNLAQPLISVMEFLLRRADGRDTDRYRMFYWTSEVIWDLLLFVLVAILIERVVQSQQERTVARRVLAGVIAAALALPFLLFANRDLFGTRWFAGASQLYNRGAALLTMGLWGALIASRNRERQLMLVCVGLGINVTGAAVAWGVRQLALGRGLASTIRDGADLFASLTYLLGLGMWCWAFRKAKSETPEASRDLT